MTTISDQSVAIRSAILAILMIASLGLAAILKPTVDTASQVDHTNFAEMIPSQFGEWILAPTQIAAINPQQQDALDQIYSQLLTRTYWNQRTGTQIMLSIAYGAEQSKQSQVHRPEVCYPAQGFEVIHSEAGTLVTRSGAIPVRRLITRQGNRTEPLTYWIRVGNGIGRGWIDQKIAIVLQGLAGKVADGVIFRVSTITDDTTSAFQTQAEFVYELLSNMRPDDLPILLGQDALGGH